HGHQLRAGARDDGGGGRPAVEDADLTAEASGCKCGAVATVNLYGGLPDQQEVKGIPGSTLRDQRAAGRNIHLVCARDKELQLLLAAAGEKRDLAQRVDLCIAHYTAG